MGVTHFCLLDLTRPTSRVIGETTDILTAKNLIALPQSKFQICVMENISPSFIELIGSMWDLDVEFFVDHSIGCRGDLSRIPLNLASSLDASPYLFLDGVLAYSVADLEAAFGPSVHPVPWYLNGRKHYFRRDYRMRTDGRGFQMNTRTSYYAKKLHSNGEDTWIVICLIDPPILPARATDLQGIVRHPPATLWQGALMSTASDFHYRDGLYSSFIKSLSRDRSLPDRCSSMPFAPAIFLCLNTALMWQEMSNRLLLTVKRIAFAQIQQNPSLALSHRLHEMRENVFYMQKSIRHSLQTLKRLTGARLMTREDSFTDISNSPKINLTTFNDGIYMQLRDLQYDFEMILEEADRLDSMIVTSFGVLMNTIVAKETQLSQKSAELGIQHSELGIEQSKVGLKQAASVKLLTQLAFFYIPLTLTCGIFGMNLQELNGNGLHIWVFVITGIAVTGITGLAFILMKMYTKHFQKEPSSKSVL
ncbi:hypothetical protein N7472_001994 [Penicillium cf. griseofulvum]|uniref:Uncharacterized protein n=1 Tax=Penicillium cf. griseofulvum TaxID=2972120 RepID=A0A9W9MQB6_9EURO|nr:hypothetical protein N7472_001994 [Penicillium cf. griseofulvum]